MAVDPKFEKFYNKAIAEGYSDDEIVSGWKKMKAAKPSNPIANMIGEGTAAVKSGVSTAFQNHPVNLALRAMGLEGAANEYGDLTSGFVNSFVDLPMTAMSLIDTEGSKSAVDKLRQSNQELTRGSGIGQGIGEVGSFVVPGAAAMKAPKIAAALRSLPTATSTLGRTLAAMGAGAGGSAAQGVLAPVGTGEGRTDSIAQDAILGGLTAGIVPAAGKVVNTIRSVLPEKGVRDLASDVIGNTSLLENTRKITDLGTGMSGKVNAASKRADTTFAGKGPITLPAGKGSFLDASKYPVIRDTIEGLQARLKEAADMGEDFSRSIDPNDAIAMRRTLVDMQKGSKGVPPTATQRAEIDAAIADLDTTVKSVVDSKSAAAYDKAIAARERSDLFLDPDSVTGKGVKAGFEGSWADDVLSDSKRVDDAVRMLTPASQRSASPMEEALRVRLAAALRDNPHAARSTEVTERLLGQDRANYIRDASGKMVAPEDSGSWASLFRKIDPADLVQRSFRGVLPYGKRNDIVSKLAESPFGLALLSSGVTGSME